MPDWVAEEAYSREESSCGFWTGNDGFPQPAFYCYLYPEPQGYKMAKVEPEAAFYNSSIGKFILPYDKVQQSEEPEKSLLNFLKSTYQTGANIAKWDREILEH